jgi:hypothetical protein
MISLIRFGPGNGRTANKPFDFSLVKSYPFPKSSAELNLHQEAAGYGFSNEPNKQRPTA